MKRMRDLVVALLGIWLLWLAAYQAPLQMAWAIGGDVASQRRMDEDAFIRGAHASEPPTRTACLDDPSQTCWWWEVLAPGERPYRWTQAQTQIALHGVGGGAYRVTLSGRGQPGTQPTLSTWQMGAVALQVALPANQVRRFHILTQADAAGNLNLSLHTAPFIAGGDPRELGFVWYELGIAQLGAGPRSPAWPVLGWLSLSLIAVYAGAHLLTSSPRLNLGLLWGLGLAGGLALALARLATTTFAPTLAGIAGVALVLAGMGWLATRNLGNHRAFVRQVVALSILALALRSGGMLHPHARYSDSMFHANKLFALSLGNVFQSAGLPSEAGGGMAPYPTGMYMLLLPGQLLVEDRLALVQIGTAALDSLVVAGIALLLVASGLGHAAALLGAACYLLPIPVLESLSVGELANVGGQIIAFGFVALVVVSDRRAWSQAWLIGAVGLLSAGLLAHSGVTLSLGAFTAGLWLLALIRWIRGKRDAGLIGLPHLTLVASGALGLVLLIYYSAPVYLNGMLERVGSSDTGGGGGRPLGAIIGWTLGSIVGVRAPGGHPLPPLLGVVAVAGLGWLWRQREAQMTGLRMGLGGLWIGMVLSQAILLVADQGVRWALFLYPGLCLSAGAMLGVLWQRGRMQRLVALGTLAIIMGYGLMIWIMQVRDYLHT
ncbi:hypothetical protein [Candidatus Oscillochloris fontis]|uniref:hypothetical protein n=1 Tax=Candidatus Oscillochloris fontis TaxID=2496868 RepID=UPI00101D11A5|nr:hypothetical protein [Candidatus Oscillochloris fontis]